MLHSCLPRPGPPRPLCPIRPCSALGSFASAPCRASSLSLLAIHVRFFYCITSIIRRPRSRPARDSLPLVVSSLRRPPEVRSFLTLHTYFCCAMISEASRGRGGKKSHRIATNTYSSLTIYNYGPQTYQPTSSRPACTHARLQRTSTNSLPLLIISGFPASSSPPSPPFLSPSSCSLQGSLGHHQLNTSTARYPRLPCVLCPPRSSAPTYEYSTPPLLSAPQVDST